MLMLVFLVLEVGTLLLDYKNLEQPERLLSSGDAPVVVSPGCDSIDFINVKSFQPFFFSLASTALARCTHSALRAAPRPLAFL